MKKTVLAILFLGLNLHAILAQDDTTVIKPVQVPAGYTGQLNAVYKTVGDWDGRVDIYYNPATDKPMPLLINIHGGAWRHGTKESQSGFATYFKAGFAVANVEYRLSAQGKAPAAVEDVRCAMLFLVNHADSFHIDITKIVFAGSSAGAQLALLAGLMDNNNNRFDNGCTGATKKYKVAAIIAQSTPSVLFDTAADGSLKVLKDGAVYEWLGNRKEDVEFARQLSPVTYISKESPPVFLTHGDADPRVPYGQSVSLDAKLTAAAVKHVFVTIPGGGHGRYPKEKQDEIKKRIAAFLQENVLDKK